jgi:hypothetical protein
MARIFVIEDEKIADAIEILLEKKKQMCARERSTKSYGSGFIGSCGGSHTPHRSSGFIGSCGGFHTYHSGCGSSGCGGSHTSHSGCGGSGRKCTIIGGCGYVNKFSSGC